MCWIGVCIHCAFDYIEYIVSNTLTFCPQSSLRGEVAEALEKGASDRSHLHRAKSEIAQLKVYIPTSTVIHVCMQLSYN